MSFLRWFREDNSVESPLWEDGISIFQHISNNLDPQTDCLAESAYVLPDEEKIFQSGGLRWVPGGMDGAMGHHFGVKDDKQAKNLAKLLHKYSKKGSSRVQKDIYKILLGDDVLSYVDAALENAVNMRLRPDPYLHDFAIDLATASPDRGPVKFAIALLGLIRDPADLAIIKVLGKHEEFTLYSAVAIRNIAENPENDLFELAKSVHGWGKIYLVEQLAGSKDPQIKRWLIRDGYKNSIMNEYLAYKCAVGGELHLEIARPSIDEELFDGTGEILVALISGGPAEDIRDYAYGADVITAYLGHFNHFSKTIKHYLVLRSIDSYLSDDFKDKGTAEKNGWSEEDLAQTLEDIQEICDSQEWRELTIQGLASNSDIDFYQAERAAQYLGIDTWRYHWERLQADAINSSYWYYVMRDVNEDRIDEVISLATEKIPLDKIATGPAQEMGLGPEYQIHSCLDFILQELGSYPGKGEILIIRGLASPLIRNRNMALRALSEWRAEDRSEQINQVLQEALEIELDNDVKSSIRKVIDGESLLEDANRNYPT